MFIATPLESIKQTLRYVFFSNDLQDGARIFETYIPPSGRQGVQEEEAEFDIIGYIQTFLENSNKQSLLVLGDAGMGKTLLSQYIAKQIWDDLLPLKAERIPIYIYLPAMANRQGELKERLLETYLEESSGLERKDVFYLKTQKIPLLLILDGVDEIRLPGNLYVQNQWEQWNLKLIFTCRPEALISYQNYQQYFYSNPDNVPCTALFSEVRLCPFDDRQIEQYIREQLRTLPPEVREPLDKIDSKWLSANSYIQAINTLPGLRGLVETPFILSMAVQVLPEIVQAQSKNPSQNHLARAELYRVFTQKWFERQAVRLQNQKRLPPLKGKLASYLLHYAKNLALDRLVQGKLETAIESKDTLAFYLLVPKDPELLASYELDQKLLEENIEAVRSGCLLKTQGKGFRFLHKSLLEYLAAEELLSGALGLVQTSMQYLFENNQVDFRIIVMILLLLSYYSLVAESRKLPLLMNTTIKPQGSTGRHYLDKLQGFRKRHEAGYAFQEQLLVDEPEIIARLAEFAQSNDSFKEALWQLIQLSKEDPYYSIAAANAVSVWHRAGFSLINLDLRNVRLAGADLRGAVLIGSQLDGADLRNVWLGGANLSLASLQGAHLAGVQLEQNPMLEHRDFEGFFAFEPEGALSQDRVAVGDGRYVYIYRVDTGELLVQLANWSIWRGGLLCDSNTYDLIWQPQGQQLAVSSGDGYIRLWDMQSYRCVWILEACRVPSYDFIKISYHPNGEQLVSMQKYEYESQGKIDIYLWDTTNGRKQKVLKSTDFDYSFHSKYHYSPFCIKYNPNGKQLAVGSEDRVALLNAKNGEEEKVLLGHTDEVSCVCYSPDGKQVASGSKDRTIILWDVASGTKQNVLQWHANSISILAYRPDGQQLASGGEDMRIVLWDVANGKKQRVLHNSWPVYSLNYYQHGEQLASSGQNGIHFWQVVDGNKQIEKGLTSLVYCLSYRPDGLQFASSQCVCLYGKDYLIRLWGTMSGELKQKLAGNTKPTTYLCYSPDGQQLASLQLLEKKISLWDVVSGKQQSVLEHDDNHRRVTCLSYRPDGLQLASSDKYMIHLWDIASGKEQLILDEGHIEAISSIQYSPSGRQLASIDRISDICLWDTVTGKLQKEWKGGYFSAGVLLRYRPDGQQLATSIFNILFWSCQIKLWDMKNYRCLQVLKPHKNETITTCMSYSLDGQYLAAGGLSKRVYLWNTSSGNCLATFDLLDSCPLASQFSQHGTLQVGYSNCISIELEWQDKANQFKLLHISNNISPKLTCLGTRLDNSFGLSRANLKVLQQQGATGYPSKDKYWSRGVKSTLFQAVKPAKQGVKNIIGNHVVLNGEFGAVSLVRSKDGNHAFFLIEIATNRGIKVHFSDLTTQDGLLLQSTSYAKARIKLEPWRDDPIFSKLKEKVKDEFIYRTFQVPLDKLSELYVNIEQDKNKDIYYCISGGLGSFSIGDKTYQNCMTWCLEKLEEIGIKLPKEWLPSPKLYLPAIKIEEEEQGSSLRSK